MKTLADLPAPQKATRKLLEKDTQKQCVDWARARGYWARKFSSMTQNSVPDYLFAKTFSSGVFTADIKFACEFKRPGKTPTEAQRDEMEAMRKAGWVVFWVSDVELFKHVVKNIEERCGV